MAQHDYVISNGTGAAVRSDLNNALLAIVSQNSGATEPTTTYAYQWWADTTTGLLKIRNSANNAWITLRELDGTLTIEDGTVSAPGLAFRDDLNTGIWRPGTDQFAISTNGVERVEWGTSEVVFNDGGTNYDFRVEGDNNANLLFVDASADAVGIGTSSPGDYASGANNLVVGNTSAANGLTILTGTSNSGAINFADGTSGTDRGRIDYDHGDDRMRFYTASSQRAVIDSSGRLGIGTTSVSSRLHVLNPSGGSGTTEVSTIERDNSGYFLKLYRNAGSGNAGGLIGADSVGTYYTGGHTTQNMLYIDGANAVMQFYTNNLERGRWDSSGRFLVGTSSARSNIKVDSTSANTPLIQLEGSNNSYSTSFSITNYNTNSYGPAFALNASKGSQATPAAVSSGGDLGFVTFNGYDGTNFIPGAHIAAFVDGTPGANDMPGRLVFSTTADGASSPTERVRIPSGPYLLVGTTVSGTDASRGVVLAADPSNETYLRVRHDSGASSGGWFAGFQYNNSTVGSITQNGTTGVTYNTSSDYRLKENIVAIANGITRLQQLKPCAFNFISEPDRTVDGFIAHEVQTVVPEAITGEKDAVDDEGSPIYQGIDQSKLVPLLTAALQEAVAKIESLEARLTAAGI